VNTPILNELVGDRAQVALDAERRARRDSCENDFFKFCQTYLPHYFGADPAPYHRILMDIVSSGRLGAEDIAHLQPLIKEKYHHYMAPTEALAGIIDVEPRGFSKSTRFSLAFPIWLVLYKKRRFPIIFGGSQAMANDALQSIKDEFEQNERIADDFGEMKGKIWKANKITLANGLAIAARGAGSSTRGIKNGPDRPDIAICDDIMTDLVAASKKGRDKIYRWFKRVVLPLGKDIFPVLINTIFHEDDIVCRLLKELSEGQLKGWVGFRFAARTPSGESLWPAYWTEAKLRKKEDELGSAAWSTEMMNEPLSSEDAIIKKFVLYELREINVAAAKKFGGIDPATGAHDKCAFDTLADPDTGVLYVLDSWGERLAEAGFLDKIIDTFLIYRHASIGFEDVAFQGIYKNNLMEKAAARKVWLPITGRKTGGLSKVQRIKEIAPLIEAGFIRFLASQKELMEQLSMFTPDGPKSAYDDEADALWIAYKQVQLRKGQGIPSVVPFEQFGARHTASTILKGFRGRR
jgi:predicted phage terminase large subunit-like protein